MSYRKGSSKKHTIRSSKGSSKGGSLYKGGLLRVMSYVKGSSEGVFCINYYICYIKVYLGRRGGVLYKGGF